MNIPKNAQGFTLIELLIASALLSMLLLSASMAYSLFANNWNKERGNYRETTNLMRDIGVVRKVINSSYPLIVSNDQGKNALYWDGKETSLQAASRSSMFLVGEAVYQIKLENGEDGKKKLVYQEAAMEKTLLDSYNHSVDFQFKKVLLDDVMSIKFQYYGWLNSTQKNQRQANLITTDRKWYSSFNAKDKLLFPEKVKVTITFNTKQKKGQSITLSAILSTNSEIGLNDGL
ncbi:prepilin-type N-terminal cleavage/methylation domain-containing protein [Vibrio rotiferianus]|uniref:prepilin-type N-terminal cleavage/methylation domain-containing protein n=1 Tax=Vibrio rotiferianus TaxID=190895 RepID=UPI002895285C|nr:conserved hypothetical protein [Vibrio rotiferianus]